MADDIVERLREESLRPAIRDVCTIAAAEIERLRNELRKMTINRDVAVALYNASLAEP